MIHKVWNLIDIQQNVKVLKSFMPGDNKTVTHT